MTQIKSHPNAHILAQLAEIAKTNPQPWKRLERYGSAGWITCNDLTPVLNPKSVLRIRPATVDIDGVELELPLREVPEKGTRLWLLFDNTRTPDVPISFHLQLPDHIKWLNERRLFASKEARDNYQDTLVKLANGGTK